MEYFFYGIWILLIGGLISIVIPERFKGICTAAAAVASTFFILIPVSGVLITGGSLTSIVALTEPIGSVSLVIDRLSAFFMIVISLMSSVSTIYASGNIKQYYGKDGTTGSHFFFMALLIASMLLVVAVQNAIAFLISWEIMSLSSFFLIVFENEKEEVFKAGINYLISMHIGVLFLISAFIIAVINSGSLNFSDFQELFRNQKGLVNPLFLLFFAGFGTKAGFIPFHTWLPRTYPVVPNHISGIMSGVMSKTGIYGILRIIMLIGEPTYSMAYFVLFISLLTGVLGIAYATVQENLKKLISYSSIENIGIIGIGIGIGLLGMVYKIPMLAILGFSGGILHVLNHSIFKSILFYGSGSVLNAMNTLEIEKLGGLIKTMKWTAAFFLIGSFAISGLPPLNGFISEFYIYWGMISGLGTNSVPLSISLIVSFAGLSFIGAMALMCFTKVFSVTFLGSPRSVYRVTPNEASWPMRIAMMILCLFIIVIVSAPAIIFNIIKDISLAITNSPAVTEAGRAAGTIEKLTLGFTLFICIFAVIYILRNILLRHKSAIYNTWGCGYQAGNTRMQYTASSFTGTFLKLWKPVFKFKENIKLPSGPFPKEAAYTSDSEDKLESLVIKPVLVFIERFLNLFKWIQSGNTQTYILYGLIFLIAVTLWMIGV